MPSPVLQQKHVLLLLLLLSFTLSSVAAHAAAISKPFRVLNPPLDDSDVPSSVEETVDLGDDDNTEELAEVKWGDTSEEKKRMTWETTDYPDTGPNHHHHHHDSNTPSHP